MVGHEQDDGRDHDGHDHLQTAVDLPVAEQGGDEEGQRHVDEVDPVRRVDQIPDPWIGLREQPLAAAREGEDDRPAGGRGVDLGPDQGLRILLRRMPFACRVVRQTQERHRERQQHPTPSLEILDDFAVVPREPANAERDGVGREDVPVRHPAEGGIDSGLLHAQKEDEEDQDEGDRSQVSSRALEGLRRQPSEPPAHRTASGNDEGEEDRRGVEPDQVVQEPEMHGVEVPPLDAEGHRSERLDDRFDLATDRFREYRRMRVGERQAPAHEHEESHRAHDQRDHDPYETMLEEDGRTASLMEHGPEEAGHHEERGHPEDVDHRNQAARPGDPVRILIDPPILLVHEGGVQDHAEHHHGRAHEIEAVVSRGWAWDVGIESHLVPIIIIDACGVRELLGTMLGPPSGPAVPSACGASPRSPW